MRYNDGSIASMEVTLRSQLNKYMQGGGGHVDFPEKLLFSVDGPRSILESNYTVALNCHTFTSADYLRTSSW